MKPDLIKKFKKLESLYGYTRDYIEELNNENPNVENLNAYLFCIKATIRVLDKMYEENIK